jgi:hypothetical protein
MATALRLRRLTSVTISTATTTTVVMLAPNLHSNLRWPIVHIDTCFALVLAEVIAHVWRTTPMPPAP